jgi:hypothetical protein
MNLQVRSMILLLFALAHIHPLSQIVSPGNNSIFTDSVVNTKHEYTRLTVRNAPALTLQFNIDYDYGIFELSANDNGDLNMDQFVNGKDFGVRHGFGASVTAKYPLHKSGNVRLSSSFMFNRFTSQLNKVFADEKEKDFVKYNVYSFMIGIEDNFNPGLKIRAFIGGGLLGSIISGNARVSNASGISVFSVKPAFRLGLAAYSGFEYLLSKNMGLSLGFKFTHANLWLKESKASGSAGEIYLNDQRVYNNQLYSGYRQFAWGSFEIGFNYYLGVKEKEYYYKK